MGESPSRKRGPSQTGSVEPINTQHHAAKRPAENVSNGNSRHKPRHRLGPILINEPVRKINNHTGEKACLGCAEQETRAEKLQRRADKTSECCECAPDYQRCREEKSSTPAFHQQRPGNLQRKISNKKNSAGRAKH